MDAKDLAYTNRVWRGKSMTVPREQLIRLDIGPERNAALVQQYRDRHFFGPYWSNKRSMWYVQVCYGTGCGSATDLYHYSGNLEDFLDIAGIVEKFHQHGLPRKEKYDGHTV